MLNGSLLGVISDAKGLAGKAVAVMLTIALALMAWSPVTVGAAFADDDQGAKTSTAADADAASVKDPAASQTGKAEDGSEDASSDDDGSSDEKPTSSDPSAADGNGEAPGDDSGTGTDKPEGTDEGDNDTPLSDKEEIEPSDVDGASTPIGEGESGEGDEFAPGSTQPGDGVQPGDGDSATPANPADKTPQSSVAQNSNVAPGGSAEAPAPKSKAHPGITAAAKVLSKPTNGKTYGAGETIKFQIAVLNTGDVPLYNVRVSNLISGAISAPVLAAGDGYTVSGTIASVATLNPGKKVSIPVSYKVLAADAGASISDTAVVKAVSPTDLRNPISASASTGSVKVTSIPSPTAAPKAIAPPAPSAPIISVGVPVAKIEHEAEPLPTIEPQRKTPPEKKGDAAADDEGSWQLSDLLPLVVVGALCLAVLIAAFIHKRREAAQEAAS